MVSIIRDYLDALSNFLDSSAGYFDLIKITLLFFFQSFSAFLHYLVTFAWFRDVMYLPLLIPKCQQAILSEHFFYQDLNVPFFQNFGSLNEGMFGAFFLGFLNSFFCCLPFSTMHILNIRRLFVQGPLAGAVSTAGLILGQVTFIFCTIFGFRSLVIPWFSLDPLSYILGLVLVFTIVYEMAAEERIRTIESSEKKALTNIFFISLLLTWTDQTSFGHLLTNLNVTNEPSVLNTTSFSHFGYLIGILFGHVFFSALFLGLASFIKDALLVLSKLPYSIWLNRVNSILLIVVIGMSCSSFPYYSLDYLMTGSLGFISQDKGLENSIFTQKNMKDPCYILTSMDYLFPFPIDTDISYFDRAEYGEQPGYFQRSFEDLNYQGEYAWLVRRDKKPDLYSSGQTTRTAIHDLFQLEPTTTNASPQVTVVSQAKQESEARNAKKTVLGNWISSKKIHSKDRLRFKNRYDKNYQETRANNSYLIGESFHRFPAVEETLNPLEMVLKQKYYNNRVYQTLLNLEVDAFMQRQPVANSLTSEEEALIHEKRLLLSKYHDTIREYQKLPYKDEFNEFFQGSKTFVDRAYNHQFKGNLGTVRRLFAVTFDKEDNLSQNAVLKYDQPLFNQPNTNNIVHEELLSLGDRNKSPFIEFHDSTPFYLGWDNETRQMIVTKRFASHIDNVPVSGNFALNQNRQFVQFLENWQDHYSEARKDSLTFTTWPLQKNAVLSLKSVPKFSNEVITLFEPFSNLETTLIAQVISTTRTGSLEIFSFPANMRFFGKVPERLAPNHGGFIWPGNHSSLKN